LAARARQCAARTHLFGFINTQNGTLRTPLPIAVSLLLFHHPQKNKTKNANNQNPVLTLWYGSRRQVNNCRKSSNSNDAHNIRYTRVETLATARAPGTLKEKRTRASGGTTAEQETTGTSRTPTTGTPEQMETTLTERMLTRVGTPATPGS
jgi:hypothetical protein